MRAASVTSARVLACEHEVVVAQEPQPGPLVQVRAERRLERRHDPARSLRERHGARPARRESELGVRPPAHERLVEVRRSRRRAREIGPAGRARVREVPDAALAVDQQVERGVHEVGHVRRRHDEIVRRVHGHAQRQRRERPRDEVPVVPRAEERRGAHDERAGMRCQHARLALGLAPAVHAERRDGVRLHVRARPCRRRTRDPTRRRRAGCRAAAHARPASRPPSAFTRWQASASRSASSTRT